MTRRLRPAAPADLAAIARLHAGSWRTTPAYADALGADGLRGLDAAMAAIWVPERLGICAVLCAVGAGGLDGFVAWRRQAEADTGAVCLDNLHVAAAARGQGVGGRLLAAAAAAVRGSGARALWLQVLEPNGPARRFYAARGGREGPAHADTLLGRPVRAVPIRWEGAAVAALAAPAAATDAEGR